ncbi:MAG: hypothetical protein GY713_04735, partial [Actinomycetia bacterium]|nr:hypothetical protein [Actinomycetes bacterium]
MKTYRRGTRKTYLRISIAAALLVLCAFPSLAGDSTVPTDFATIQAAIDDPGTMAGDTINVLAGTYAEGGIHVTKSVTIAGAGIGSTFIEPPGAVGFFPDADNVTLEDMTIRNGSQAVRFEKTGGTITGPTLTRVELKDNSSRGIELHNATTVTGLTVEDCNFESTNIGFRVSSSGHLDGGMFTGSTFTGNTIGIYEANDGGTSTLNDVDITGCTFTDHTSDQGTAIFLEEAEDVAILDNTFVDNRRDIQLFKWYQPAVPMSNISISGNTMTGTTDTVFALFNAHHVDGQTEFDGISFTNNIVSVDSSGANNGSAVYAGAHSTYLNATPSNGGIGWNTVEINCNLFTGLKAGTGVRYYNPKVPVGQELGGASLDVENNWWGTDSAPAIDALMQVPSITDYVPFLPTLPPRPECPGLPALPTVDFTAAAQSNSESVTTVTVTAQLSSLWGLEVQVPLLFSGSAADPADYSPDVTTLTIPAGTLSADLTLTVVDDAIDEPSELVDVQMGTPVNALPGTVTLHSAIIQDNDPPPTVDFTASFQSNAESVTPVTVTAQLSAVSAFTVQVPLTFGGSAADPADYSPDVTTLTIPAGMLSADLTLTVVDDALDELTEVIDVMMGVPVNAAPGTTTVHTALIQDNDDPPVVDFTAAAQSNDEGVTPVTATAQLSGPSGLDVEVPLTFGGTATDPDDYSPNTITLPTITIPAGMTTGTQTLTVVDDAIDENDETVVITMGTPTNATLGTTTVHTATIEDNDATPTVDFTAAAQSNDESVASVTVTAQLSAVSGLEVQVPLVFGGTATDPDDYGPDLTTLTIAAGTTSADLILTVVEDAIDENDETVIVTMGTPVNATPGSTTVQTVTIEDNDATPTVDFTAAAQSNDESVASVTVTAQLSAVSG